MKFLDDYEQLELAELTEEEIEILIEIECAQEGVKIPGPHPVEPIEVGDIEPDRKVWRVPEFTFEDEAEAAHVMDVIRGCKTVVALMGYPQRINPSENPLERRDTPILDRVYSEGFYQSTQAERENHKRSVELYREAKKEFDELQGAYLDIRDKVYGVQLEAKARVGRYRRLQDQWKEYLELAGGNDKVASGFMINTYEAELGEFPEMRDMILQYRDAPEEGAADE